MNKILFSSAVLSLLCINVFASADGGSQIAVGAGFFQGATISTGYRFSGNYYLSNAFAIRAEYNSWKLLNSTMEDIDVKVDGNKFKSKFNGHSYDFLVDYYPFASTWFLGNIRLTGGYYFGDDTTISLNHSEIVNGTYSFEFNDHKYQISASNTKVDFNAKVAPKVEGPYFGTGFDLELFSGFKLFMDAGFIKIKKSDLIVNINPNNSITVTEDGNSSSISAVEQNMYEAINDSVGKWIDRELFPIVKVGILYRF